MIILTSDKKENQNQSTRKALLPTYEQNRQMTTLQVFHRKCR